MRARFKLLGFDAREMRPALEAWSQDRRAAYLLRTDVDQPLATDPLVWPSILSGLSARAGMAGPVQERNSLGVWNSLSWLRAYLDEIRPTLQSPYWLIGISLSWSALTRPERELWQPRLPATEPSRISKRWSFLGYDVSDMALLSCLSNCGYDPQDVQFLRARWGQQLNDFHLFTDLAQAIQFEQLSNRRVREHAPFFVYGLYRIMENCARGAAPAGPAA